MSKPTFGRPLGPLFLACVLGCRASEGTDPADASSGDPNDDSTSTSAVDDSTSGAESTSGAGSTDDTGEPNPEDVPAVPLDGDPARDCPAAFVDAVLEPGQHDGFESAGQSRDFWLVLPDALDGPRPLLVAFNGTGETGRSFSDRARLEDFAADGFIVVAPSSAGNGTVWPVWDAMREADDHDRENADLVLFDELLPCLAGHLPIDANRLYVAGHSAGGIMTNYVMQRRSELLAGGIVASGVFSLTSPPRGAELDETFVLVTWGGPNDTYSGSAGGVSVPSINFVEQASLASKFYTDQPAVGQANCEADLGHAWLSPLNRWMAQVLLEHPKGVPGASSLDLPTVPTQTGATCMVDPFEYDPGLSVSCPASRTPGCQAACQLFGDCAVENGTVGPILAQQLAMLGFAGDDNLQCEGCIDRCEQQATTATDAAVLQCIASAASTAACGSGIEGAQPLIDAVNDCCDGQAGSGYCADVCSIIETNPAAATFFGTCEQF